MFLVCGMVLEADYTMMGERLANNLLLLSRVWSRHIITYTFLNAHTEESLTPKFDKRSFAMVTRSARACVRVGVQEHGDCVTPELRARLNNQRSLVNFGVNLS